MTSRVVLLLLLAVCGSAFAVGREAPPNSRDRAGMYSCVVRGEELAVTVWFQYMLYKSSESDHFFVRLSVDNKTGTEIGVDLRDYSEVLRPIQWVGNDETYLSVINIRTPVPPVLTPEYLEEIDRAWLRGDLAVIEQDAILNYFADFNAGAASDVQDLDTSYFHLALGGWLTVTDGSTVEVLSLPEGFKFYRMALPLSWQEMYSTRTIAGDSSSGSVVVYW